MAKTPSKTSRKKKQPTPKKYAKPLSLHPLNFVEAVDSLLAAKPANSPVKKKSR